MNYTTEIKRGTNSPVLAATVRIILGLAIMIAGLYFWLFLDGKADDLGLLFLLISPFIILTDKAESETRF